MKGTLIIGSLGHGVIVDNDASHPALWINN